MEQINSTLVGKSRNRGPPGTSGTHLIPVQPPRPEAGPLPSLLPHASLCLPLAVLTARMQQAGSPYVMSEMRQGAGLGHHM